MNFAKLESVTKAKPSVQQIPTDLPKYENIDILARKMCRPP